MEMNSEGGMRSPFTVSQLQELDQQALIFKYMMAGEPLPTNLVLSIQKSLESISNRFFHHPTMDYSSLYKKKMDPEPGRCRRTDGKKWRCTRDVYAYSKYCERHMHRGRNRNRSRKPVESQMQSPSTVTPLTVTGSSTEGSGSFQNLPLNSFDNIQGTGFGVAQSHYLIDSIPYGIPNKDYSYINQGLQLEVGQHSFFSNASGNIRGLHLDSPLDNTWPLLQSRADTFFPTSNSGDNCNLVNECPQHSFYNSEFTSEERVKHQGQFVRPFFKDWPMNSFNFSEASTSQLTQDN